jgi:hypothetical protein
MAIRVGSLGLSFTNIPKLFVGRNALWIMHTESTKYKDKAHAFPLPQV